MVLNLHQDFKKEVEIMARLRHPNTLLFMGACTTPGERERESFLYMMCADHQPQETWRL
jgi:hypothetical protein